MYTWFCHEIHDCHSGSNGRNIIFGRVQGAMKHYLLYAENCRGEPQNLANWSAEFGKKIAVENCDL